ncbi:MAG: YhfC family intramembrane metalloprotease [Chloroflexota bacterium]|nr:MAG: YhfC family intramembrane metalloprotease [Chloroflexota bacterium]
MLAGAGHGGIEAIFLAGLILLGFINAVVSQSMDFTTLGLSPDQLAEAQGQISAYWSTPWYMSLMGFVERLFALPLHIALSVMVLQVFTHKQVRWLWLAILWHAVVDGVAVFLVYQWQGYDWYAYAMEGVIGVFALISLGILFALRQLEPVEPGPADLPPVDPPAFIPQPIEETPETLDKTRFQ